MEEPPSSSYDPTVVTPLYKARLQGLDARFTLVGLVERSSPPVETACNLFNALMTLSDGMDYALVCISLPRWESHPSVPDGAT